MVYKVLFSFATAIFCFFLKKNVLNGMTEALLKKRKLEYSSQSKNEKLLYAVMVTFGGLFTFIYGLSYEWVLMLEILCVCEIIADCDWQHRIIPTDTWFVLIAIRIVSVILGFLNSSSCNNSIVNTNILDSAIGFVVLGVIFCITKTIGMGDVRLATNIGFILGWKYGLLSVALMGLTSIFFNIYDKQLFLSSFSRTVKSMKETMPLGPAFCLSFLIVLAGLPFLSI